jgi:hypothetical protein
VRPGNRPGADNRAGLALQRLIFNDLYVEVESDAPVGCFTGKRGFQEGA